MLAACDGSPGGGEVDAGADGLAVDGAAIDASAPDADPDACAVIAAFQLAVPGQTLYQLELAATPTGWLAAYSALEPSRLTAWLTVLSSSGQVTMAPTQVGEGEAHVAVSGDRALVVAGASMQVRGLDGSAVGAVLPVGGSQPGMTAKGVVAAPSDGFRVLRTAVQPAMFPFRPYQSDVEVASLDRDGAVATVGPASVVAAIAFDGASAHAGGMIVPVRSLHGIGGCVACNTGGLAQFDADGSISAMELVTVDGQHGAILGEPSAAGDQLYVGWTLRGDADLRVAGNVARSATDTAYTVDATSLSVVATAPRAGLVGGDGAARWLQRFDDTAGFSLGARCGLALAPWRLRVRGPSVLVVDDTGHAQLVTAP